MNLEPPASPTRIHPCRLRRAHGCTSFEISRARNSSHACGALAAETHHHLKECPLRCIQIEDPGVLFDAFSWEFYWGTDLADVNHDGFTNGDDFDYFAQHFDGGC